jgi:hypothetical protein
LPDLTPVKLFCIKHYNTSIYSKAKKTGKTEKSAERPASFYNRLITVIIFHTPIVDKLLIICAEFGLISGIPLNDQAQ